MNKSKNIINKEVNEFKAFITRGNVIDLTVGVIIGGAFGKIVTSLVNDILMPLIGIILGGLDFTSLSITIKDANIMYGSFIQQIIDFLIISLCIFVFIKIINRFKRKEIVKEEKKELPEEVKLLTEIRDLLKKN
ncbi:MAG: large-conductance mechanosensitive channel protein MscL [Bacilli bacterium]|nr:large-conductance mechanosensitive channel protein MscL [Bacilli bacterium]